MNTEQAKVSRAAFGVGGSNVRPLLLGAALCGISFFLGGFLPFNANEPRLPATVASPVVRFVWDGKSPPLKDKDQYRDGIYLDLSDEDFMERVLVDAFAQWNGVRGSYLIMSIMKNTETASINPDDMVYSIVVQTAIDPTQGGVASPIMPIDSPYEGKVITDCDIEINDQPTYRPSDLLRTLVHEIGHCVGLGHNHSNYGSIMGYSRDTKSGKLGADDIAGTIYLYRDPAYGDGGSKEDVQCGVVAAASRPDTNGRTPGALHLTTVLFLATPLLFTLAGAVRPACCSSSRLLRRRS